MSEAVHKQLIDNISIILKKSLAADATLATLREAKQASFAAIFTADAGFKCTANTFQPYVEEVANDLIFWQKTSDQQTLINIVKKIEQLFTVLAKFEQS
ncbi:hypothetical protein [Cognaticolwellia aestuarii]|jgi:hypothetical protein|uniref:hypothetical protein n=1 Tax=Cognaticolwellia aestuarii TaxID=329993 RepID=UPI0007912C1B|nr:hypothetical protein [Cognaticolwellia aestuarii]KXJ56647.1 MAG: hypothetical protein AXW17_13605 [Colwellia sp. Phe_37]|tara:strand:- start:21860 stop:22156 length:297 start_codon:yes stop_codon:yes gene_type:complete